VSEATPGERPDGTAAGAAALDCDTAVVIAARDPERIREALRAALGLGLRGARVAVWLGPAAAATSRDALIVRALATLGQLGWPVHHGEPAPEALPAGAQIERWTDAGPATRIVVLREGDAVRTLPLDDADPDALVAAVMAADGAAVW
jgi:hypothetical protein